MTIYTGDQPTLVPVGRAGGTLGAADGGVLATEAAAVYVFSAHYQTVWSGATLGFRPGMAYQLDPALLAHLTADGAPMVEA